MPTFSAMFSNLIRAGDGPLVGEPSFALLTGLILGDMGGDIEGGEEVGFVTPSMEASRKRALCGRGFEGIDVL